MRLLTWNLYHGRAVPGTGRCLLAEFAARLASWEWDAALLQEVPPWWPPTLARAAGAETHVSLTSRNALPAIRRAAARRLPDLIGANGGGANAILVRGPVRERRAAVLRGRPERRVAQFVGLADGSALVNLHLSRDPVLAAVELDRACELAVAWAPQGALVIGGDFNHRRPAPARPGWPRHVAGQGVDHLLARGLEARGPLVEASRALGTGGAVLSDHPALILELGAEQGEDPPVGGGTHRG